MSSIQETFAESESNSGFTTVGRKKNSKQIYQKKMADTKKPLYGSIASESLFSGTKANITSDPIKPSVLQSEGMVISLELQPSINSCKPAGVNTLIKQIQPNNSSQSSVISTSAASDDGSTESKPLAGGARSRNPEGIDLPRVRKPPSGIFVNLGPEWKKFVRDLIPNKAARTSDDTVMNEISKVKSNSTISNFEFKKIVCMMFHQALKTDRNSLVDKIINCWTRSGYNIVELIDSTFDGCKPMTQACWSGSISCIKSLIAADSSGSVLHTIHPTKNETILDTLMLGRNFAISKDPDNSIFAAERFNNCEKFIKTAMARQEAAKVEITAESSNSISPELKESIDKIVEEGSGSNDSIINLLVLKLAELYLENEEKSTACARSLSQRDRLTEYFEAVKMTVEPEIFSQIDSRLKDEGIELVIK